VWNYLGKRGLGEVYTPKNDDCAQFIGTVEILVDGDNLKRPVDGLQWVTS
jgi:hypothetical protein